LAKQNLTLLDDQTPEYWLAQSESGPVVSPFVIIVDEKEQQPFTFPDLQTGASQGYRKIVARTIRRSLGTSKGDYSMIGFEGQIHIERKSLEDAHGTILGWGERRDRFEATLSYLNQIEFGAVVVECTLGVLLANAPERGKKSKVENRRSLNATYLSWQMKYSSVPWIFCDTRGLAETETYRLFEKFYAYKIKRRKSAESHSQSLSNDLSLI
jgi:hypothetical protein